MQKRQTNTMKGFTIIEVVLVLAIAGLIFLMVFIALPALQRSQRDTQRRDDYAAISSAVTDWTTSHNGALPTAADIAAFANYVDDLVDPLSGANYNITIQANGNNSVDNYNPAEGQVFIETGAGADCQGTANALSNRQFRIIGYLENGNYCQN